MLCIFMLNVSALGWVLQLSQIVLSLYWISFCWVSRRRFNLLHAKATNVHNKLGFFLLSLMFEGVPFSQRLLALCTNIGLGWEGATTFSITTHSIMTLSIMTLSIIILRRTLNLIDSIATISICDIQYNDTQHSIEHCYADCHYVECRIFLLLCWVSLCWVPHFLIVSWVSLGWCGCCAECRRAGWKGLPGTNNLGYFTKIRKLRR